MTLPRHIAVIMDGNGRWARQRGLERFKGHLEGMKRISEVVNAASDLGVEVMTFYTFSRQNWNRPRNEVTMLMQMICLGLEQKGDDLLRRNVRFDFIGQRDSIPEPVLQSLTRTRALTAGCTGLKVYLAFNYDARSEILDGVRAVVERVQAGGLAPADVTEDVFSGMLYTRGLPDPDLLIRTSGEQRLSNFLLWQLSYTELYFTDVLWPDFTDKEFRRALDEYAGRQRRFGSIDTAA